MKTRVQFLFLMFVLLGICGSGCADEAEPSRTGDEVSGDTADAAMKNAAELQPVWIRLADEVDVDPDMQERITLVFEGYLQTNMPVDEEVLWQQLYLLLRDPNANPMARRETLQLFVDSRAAEVLRQVLLTPVGQSGATDFVISAARTLGRMKDEESLPALITVLSENGGYPTGDGATAQTELKHALMGAIRSITGTGRDTDNMSIGAIKDVDQFSQAAWAARNPQETERLISEARAWALQHGIHLSTK